MPKEREALSSQCSILSGASNFGIRVKMDWGQECPHYGGSRNGLYSLK